MARWIAEIETQKIEELLGFLLLTLALALIGTGNSFSVTRKTSRDAGADRSPGSRPIDPV
jgi:hypothetical protein